MTHRAGCLRSERPRSTQRLEARSSPNLCQTNGPCRVLHSLHRQSEASVAVAMGVAVMAASVVVVSAAAAAAAEVVAEMVLPDTSSRSIDTVPQNADAQESHYGT